MHEPVEPIILQPPGLTQSRTYAAHAGLDRDVDGLPYSSHIVSLALPMNNVGLKNAGPVARL